MRERERMRVNEEKDKKCWCKKSKVDIQGHVFFFGFAERKFAFAAKSTKFTLLQYDNIQKVPSFVQYVKF